MLSRLFPWVILRKAGHSRTDLTKAGYIMSDSSALASFDRKLLNKEFALQIINRDLLKYIALVLMTLGHWALYIYHILQSRPFMQFSIAAEYFAPPVFFFFIAEGHHYTRSKSKYAIRLLIFAVITQIPHSLTHPDGLTLCTLFLQWNVIMTLFLGVLSVQTMITASADNAARMDCEDSRPS